jgi:hypothetical protein
LSVKRRTRFTPIRPRSVPQMNVADVHQPTRIVPRGNAFFAYVERISNPNFQPA